MAVAFGDLSREYSQLKTEIDAAIQRVLSRGHFILGQEGELFERSFASYLGASDAIGVASGTEAIAVALLAGGVKEADEVLTVSYTAVPTAVGISMIGAVPKFIDVDEKTCLMDISRLAQAITPKTKAIVPVHLFGQCVDMEALMKLARKKNLLVVEDCAHAHGAAFKGKKAGTWGHAAAFSFYPSKNLGCYGDGGVVVTSDPALAEKTRMLRNYGQKVRGRNEVAGLNSRLDELQAAILSVKLARLDVWNGRRQAVAKIYQQGLADLPLSFPAQAPDSTHVYHLFVVHTDERDRVLKFLKEEKVEAMDHYAFPAHLQPCYQGVTAGIANLPVTERKARQSLSLPMYPQILDEEVGQVIVALRRAF